jgi:hypothetical protein
MNTGSFNLIRLMTTVFQPQAGERVGVFIDLDNPQDLVGQKFLAHPALVTQRIAYDVFYEGLRDAMRDRTLPLASVEMFAYVPTGGSNLELPDTVVDSRGQTLQLERDVLTRLDIVLYLSTYSATAPITAIAKRMGFRGATMHGCNEIILQSGLAQDYEVVSQKAERFRAALTGCDDVVLEFEVEGQPYRLTLELGKQEAQKSHGLCHPKGEIANLPAGEIYWVPTGAHGQFPLKFKDGTLAIMDVTDCRITHATLVSGDQQTVAAALAKFQSDPATGELGELGLGTQVLPWSGKDIQDEKVLGTFHVATGRSDHLGGSLGPARFKEKGNATHEDILFAPHKTPEIKVPGVWMHKDGKEVLLIKDYQPTEFVKSVAL